jgi:UDP-GlcNAc:undecaprenyl-phosphate/decaprenyl-phosphate GlcNAc-1-phosphate transferase
VSIYIFYILGNEYKFQEGFQINETLFAVLVILYPLLDLLRVFILRIKEGKSPFEADQNHLHHLLNRKLNSHLSTTFIIQLVSVIVMIVLFI